MAGKQVPRISICDAILLADTATTSIDQALSALPKGFPEKIAASITEGAKRRLKTLAQPEGKA